MSPTRTTSLVLAAVLVAALAGGCARVTGTRAGSSPAPPVVIGPGQSGKTVTVRAGGTLTFQPSKARLAPPVAGYRVVDYPRSILVPNGRLDHVPFSFTAVRPGTGKLSITFGPKCPAPLATPAGQASTGVACPMVGAVEPASPPPVNPGGMAIILFTITVRVVPAYEARPATA